MLTQVRAVANQLANEVGLAVPEVGEQLALFFGGEQVRRERRLRGDRRGLGRGQRPLTPDRLHWIGPSLQGVRAADRVGAPVSFCQKSKAQPGGHTAYRRRGEKGRPGAGVMVCQPIGVAVGYIPRPSPPHPCVGR